MYFINYAYRWAMTLLEAELSLAENGVSKDFEITLSVERVSTSLW